MMTVYNAIRPSLEFMKYLCLCFENSLLVCHKSAFMIPDKMSSLNKFPAGVKSRCFMYILSRAGEMTALYVCTERELGINMHKLQIIIHYSYSLGSDAGLILHWFVWLGGGGAR